jgi:hypothetical protein
MAWQRSEEWMVKRAEKLKEDVHMMFNAGNSTSAGRMFLVDALQHLGIDHHFQEQIHITLRELSQNQLASSASLCEEALRFRLLREHGHWVSPGIYTSHYIFLSFEKVNLTTNLHLIKVLVPPTNAFILTELST